MALPPVVAQVEEVFCSRALALFISCSLVLSLALSLLLYVVKARMHVHTYSGYTSMSHTMSRNRSQIWVRAMGKVANVSSWSFPELKSAIRDPIGPLCFGQI